jgi:hypothetical protein
MRAIYACYRPLARRVRSLTSHEPPQHQAAHHRIDHGSAERSLRVRIFAQNHRRISISERGVPESSSRSLSGRSSSSGSVKPADRDACCSLAACKGPSLSAPPQPAKIVATSTVRMRSVDTPAPSCIRPDQCRSAFYHQPKIVPPLMEHTYPGLGYQTIITSVFHPNRLILTDERNTI